MEQPTQLWLFETEKTHKIFSFREVLCLFSTSHFTLHIRTIIMKSLRFYGFLRVKCWLAGLMFSFFLQVNGKYLKRISVPGSVRRICNFVVALRGMCQCRDEHWASHATRRTRRKRVRACCNRFISGYFGYIASRCRQVNEFSARNIQSYGGNRQTIIHIIYMHLYVRMEAVGCGVFLSHYRRTEWKFCAN